MPDFDSLHADPFIYRKAPMADHYKRSSQEIGKFVKDGPAVLHPAPTAYYIPTPVTGVIQQSFAAASQTIKLGGSISSLSSK
mmetsp:Transcript_12384/g.23962  ORF Transcript_12384/g.23962 Transcript_12384/m.23962 type:complete len:82 (-) Transcript_12384:226-471(-)|eukprot:6172873-Pleurochrysis_carterae.AAC.2